ADGSELHLGIQYDKRHCGLEFSGEWFGAELRAALSVGSDKLSFSGQPAWHDGYLPEAVVVFEHQGARYTLRAFGATLPCTTTRLCAWLAIEIKRMKPDAPAECRIAFHSHSRLKAESGYLFHPADKSNLLRGGFSDEWTFDEAAQSLEWKLSAGQSG